MFSSKVKIRIDKSLYQRLADAAERAGYSSTEELIVDTLARAAQSELDSTDDQDAEKQLRGLGYIE